MALPRHPEEDDETPADSAPSRSTMVIIAAVVLVILAVVVLHLTGVIGGH